MPLAIARLLNPHRPTCSHRNGPSVSASGPVESPVHLSPRQRKLAAKRRKTTDKDSKSALGTGTSQPPAQLARTAAARPDDVEPQPKHAQQSATPAAHPSLETEPQPPSSSPDVSETQPLKHADRQTRHARVGTAGPMHGSGPPQMSSDAVQAPFKAESRRQLAQAAPTPGLSGLSTRSRRRAGSTPGRSASPEAPGSSRQLQTEDNSAAAPPSRLQQQQPVNYPPTWSVFSSPLPSTPANEAVNAIDNSSGPSLLTGTASSTSVHGLGSLSELHTNSFDPIRCRVQQQLSALRSEHLAALALKWAHEVWAAVDEHAHKQAVPHQVDSQLQGLPHHMDQQAAHVGQWEWAAPQWWQGLPEDLQACALVNMVCLGEEALARLGIQPAPTETTAIRPLARRSVQPSTATHITASHATHTALPDLTHVTCLQPLASISSSSLQGEALGHARPVSDDVHARNDKVSPMQLADIIRCGPTSGVKVQYASAHGGSAGRPSLGVPEGLTRQQHAEIAWAVAHLWCAHGQQQQQTQQQTQQLLHHHQQQQHQQQEQQHQHQHQRHLVVLQALQAALGVPFCVVPLVLPGLSVRGIESEVVLGRDVIWLDNGTRAVEEPRLTGWQSEIGATFRYSGKEMQPQRGGLSPCVEKVRDVLQGLTGIKYDSVLVNLYPDGRCGMRYHADPLYGCWTPETSVVSVGNVRKFVFRDTHDHSIRWSYSVRNSDVVVMFGDCQDRLQHSVVTEATEVGPRVSLVYKQRIPGTLADKTASAEQ